MAVVGGILHVVDAGPVAPSVWPVLVILPLFFAERLTFVVEPVYPARSP